MRVCLSRGSTVTASPFELPLEHFTDEGGVRFALGELHDLAFEGVERGELAGTVVGHGGGVRDVATGRARSLTQATLEHRNESAARCDELYPPIL